jgi:DNA invertase Pin-like site-specific DNA recombinase
MNIRIGYARCSTDKQDLAAQKEALHKLGVSPERIYTDHGMSGTHRALHSSGDYSITDLAEVFSISRPTVYRTLYRQSSSKGT